MNRSRGYTVLALAVGVVVGWVDASGSPSGSSNARAESAVTPPGVQQSLVVKRTVENPVIELPACCQKGSSRRLAMGDQLALGNQPADENAQPGNRKKPNID